MKGGTTTVVPDQTAYFSRDTQTYIGLMAVQPHQNTKDTFPNMSLKYFTAIVYRLKLGEI